MFQQLLIEWTQGKEVKAFKHYRKGVALSVLFALLSALLFGSVCVLSHEPSVAEGMLSS